MSRRTGFDQEDPSVHENMTDISLSALGIVLIFFTMIAVVFRNTPEQYRQRAADRRNVEQVKQQEIRKLAGMAEEKNINVEQLNKLIQESVERAEAAHQKVEDLKSAIKRRKDRMQVYQVVENLIRRREQQKSELARIKAQLQQQKMQFEQRKRAANRDTGGRPYFAYVVKGDDLYFGGVAASRQTFDTLLKWIGSSEGGTLFASMDLARSSGSQKPAWADAVFRANGWGPFVPGIKAGF